VRPSRFRHVFAETAKPESQYLDLELSAVTGDHNYVRGNSKFFSIAVRGGGGPVQVVPYSLVGKLPRGYPTINGHSSSVYDTAWNPFNDNVLATGSDDTTVKLWHIPDGGLTESLRDPLTTLSGMCPAHTPPASLRTECVMSFHVCRTW
jgi:coronin-1B/1C/6